MESSLIENAIVLHGHLSPGIALGLRMSEIAMQRLNIKKGSKTLIAISETNRCLPDAIQIATGCTLGHSSIFLADYGKLALSLINTATKEGIRITPSKNAKSYSPLLERWMMRIAKLTKDEEYDLGQKILNLDEKYFLIQKIQIGKLQIPVFQSGKITQCSKCHEFFSGDSASGVNEKTICGSCSSEPYYKR